MDTPPIIEDQRPLAQRLARIFMPYAMKQRQDAFRAQTGKSPDDASEDDRMRFAHYTSADAAMKIINTKRMWMRNTTCMSDYSEVQHGYRMLRSFFTNEENADRFKSALNACAPGVAQEAIHLFDQWWGTLPVGIGFNTYISSISLHAEDEDQHGRLSMWRAFGGDSAARVALVLRLTKVDSADGALKLLFSPVAYLTEQQVHAVINEIIGNVRTNYPFLKLVDRQMLLGTIFLTLLAGVTCLKHRGFHEEQEWRAIYSPKRDPSPLMESSIEVIRGIPQTVYKIPLDAAVDTALSPLDFSRLFDRLIIGPSPYPWAMYEAFVAALRQAGVSDAAERVFVSDIPIRS